MHRLTAALAILYLAFFAAPKTALAQTSSAAVMIMATDQSGNRMQDVQIQLAPAPDVAASNMVTDERGGISLNLKPGHYRLTATRVGFPDSVIQIDVKPSSQTQTFTVILKSPRNSHLPVHAAPSDGTLRISAAPYHDDVSYKLADLQSMPRTTVTIHNSHANADETYSGVRLADLLSPLGVPLGKDLRGSAVALYIVAAGADNYKAVIALAEIDPAFHPGEVIVADTLNGHPLSPEHGPFRLVVSEDKFTARSVHSLVSIELKSAN